MHMSDIDGYMLSMLTLSHIFWDDINFFTALCKLRSKALKVSFESCVHLN